MTATGFFKPQNWLEETLCAISPQQKITEVSVNYSFSGQLVGKSTVQYLMYYPSFHAAKPQVSRATYVGLFRFQGKLRGREGSFVMMDKGTFENGEARSELKILSGSGTGELESISGLGRYTATKDSSLIEIHYALATQEMYFDRAA